MLQRTKSSFKFHYKYMDADRIRFQRSQILFDGSVKAVDRSRHLTVTDGLQMRLSKKRQTAVTAADFHTGSLSAEASSPA